ncbi:sodium/hydrogen exchanger [Thermodesulfatator indicus DSM 15286]|uniref:Sodium/hydrogen exchanger n=1 Tax=Thermodesulfatator indicus (strain DSM 15286 / JCM 11887 / CIR29812) TaxID=667014 RepID=F8ADA5_THEID|nr:cation:proton antiporter [Thermodesulfatator indicus]AEH44847.1 sodium/hydrogen exchanger [Thermodesulfatator indicus DSM 15286]
MVLLNDVIILLGSAFVASLIGHRFKVPNIISFIIAGALIGPYGLHLIQAEEAVHFLAELGVVLLLFTIGLEFSPAHLARLKTVALIGGGLQIALTALITGLLGYLIFDLTAPVSFFLGAYLALSSTAIVLSLLQEEGEMETPYGRASLGILLFQDMAIVPLMLLVPFLAGELKADLSLLSVVVKTFILLGGAYVLSRWVLGFFMDFVARTRSRELFLLATLTFCLIVAWAAYKAGLSLSLGAFLAGFILARSPYSHQATANILPFKDLLICVFFVSVGMFFDVRLFWKYLPLILGATAVVFLIKSSIIFGILRYVLRYPVHIAFLVGVSLFQIGEFSFVLAQEALKYNLLELDTFQLLSSVSILTMLLTPFVIILAKRHLPTSVEEKSSPLVLEDHMIIIGLGVAGMALRTAAKKVGIPYVIIEVNPETVRREKLAGEPIIFGDATYEYILRQAGLEKARVLAITIPDCKSARVIVGLAKHIKPDIYILVRTRYAAEMKNFLELGADEVIPEELVVALSMFARIMRLYLVPEEEIQQHLEEFARKHYALFSRDVSEDAARGKKPLKTE